VRSETEQKITRCSICGQWFVDRLGTTVCTACGETIGEERP
jgi:hypothetical protein